MCFLISLSGSIAIYSTRFHRSSRVDSMKEFERELLPVATEFLSVA